MGLTKVTAKLTSTADPEFPDLAMNRLNGAIPTALAKPSKSRS